MDCPDVNGVSPCEGPPGTKVKIWGDNLGVGPGDVTSILICGKECVDSMEWISNRKIICETGDRTGRGRIIITTLSGGEGTCSVYFTGMEPSAPQSPRVNPNQESNKWIEEDWNLFEDLGSGNQVMLLDSLPKKQMDPLGIMKKGTSRRMSEENIRQLCPNGSGNLLADNFNPVMYLLENHCTTNFNQLRIGLENLKREVETISQSPAEFIRDNLDSFIQCFDTLSDVNELLIRNETETETGSITDKVEDLLRDTTMHADALFQGLIQRKMKADATRNTLTVLQRYRFLFNLPRSIEKNIKNGEYEIVTNDYERAKSLFAGTKVKVFAKVLEEVESQVSKLRNELRKQLLQNPSTLEDQKRLIKYLLDLDYLGDPAWECIVQMNVWILDLLFQCKKHYQQTGDSELLEVPTFGHGHARTLSNLSYTSGGSHTPPVRVHVKTPNSDNDMKSGADQNKPKRILFIEQLIDITNRSLPNFWKLGQAYFNRSLFTTMLSENQDNIISENTSSRGGDFDNMVMEITEIYTDMVNAALFHDAFDHLPEDRVKKLGDWKPFEDNLSEVSGAWLPLCVRNIRTCLSSLQSLHLPKEPLSLIQQLAANVRMLCSDTLFLRTTKDIEVLHEREDWQVQDEEGSVITSLPVLFESIVVDVLLTLKEIVIENHPGETEVHREPLLEAAVDHFQGLLEDFARCLDHLAFQAEGEESDHPVGMSRQETVISTFSEDTLNKPSQEERLLLILSNSNYTRNHVTITLFDCFINHGYPECHDVIQEFLGLLEELDMKVFKEYISMKMDPLNQLIIPGMNGGYFNWTTDSTPVGIRSYIKEILIYLVHVHAEVYSISSHITKRVLSELLQLSTNKILTELQQIETFSKNGKLHAYIEVKCLEETLKLYINEGARSNFESLYKILKGSENTHMKRVRDIFQEFNEKTRFQFKCFQPIKMGRV